MYLKTLRTRFLQHCVLGLLAVAAFGLTATACSDDDPVEQVTPDPEPDPEPDPDPTPDPDQPESADYHFDLFMTIGQHGGMNRGDGTIVRSVDNLTASTPMIDIVGEGVEFRSENNVYSMELIAKGKYYYQVPNSSEDRFTKLQVVDNSVRVIQEQPFVQNTYSARSYTHAWLDDHTLVIMAANGSADRIIWTKLNADDMTILAEGTLDLPLPEGASVFTASGILTYREATDELFYFYFGKDKSGRGGVATSNFLSVVINPSDMTLKGAPVVNALAGEMAGSAYGELLQSCVMYDESGNLYLAAFTDTDTMEEGHLLRINAGDTGFDPAYDGFPQADGKLLTVQYLGNGKALTYSRSDAVGTGIDDYSHYYSIVDLATGSRERLQYEGQEIPYSAGRFAQRTVVVDGKAYIGVNTADANPCIYIYDIATGAVEKGAEIAEGYYFDMIRLVENNE